MNCESNSVFLPQTVTFGYLPTLFYDLLLIDGPYPALFTCTNQEETRTFLVLCPSTEKRDIQYIIVEVEPERIIALLEDNITIRDVFGDDKTTVYIHSDKPNRPQITITCLGCVDPKHLPTPGFTMDADPGEFDEEIGILRKRQETLNKKGTI